MFSFRFAVLVLVIFVVALGGCAADGIEEIDDTNYPGDLPTLLIGEWGFATETYTIEENSLEYVFLDEEWGDFGYKGEISFVSNYSPNSGVIIIRYTEFPPFGDSTKPYTAFYYRNLGNNTVQLANVINQGDFSSADTATLEEAIAKFTRGQMGNFVDWSVVNPQIRAN